MAVIGRTAPLYTHRCLPHCPFLPRFSHAKYFRQANLRLIFDGVEIKNTDSAGSLLTEDDMLDEMEDVNGAWCSAVMLIDAKIV